MTSHDIKVIKVCCFFVGDCRVRTLQVRTLHFKFVSFRLGFSHEEREGTAEVNWLNDYEKEERID